MFSTTGIAVRIAQGKDYRFSAGLSNLISFAFLKVSAILRKSSGFSRDQAAFCLRVFKESTFSQNGIFPGSCQAIRL